MCPRIRKKRSKKTKQNKEREEEMEILSSNNSVSTQSIEEEPVQQIDVTSLKSTFFISYSQNEQYETRIQEIVHFLEERGHRVIRDKIDFRPGVTIGKEIQRNFLLANCVLFLVTKEYYHKILRKIGYCYDEWKLTHNSERHIYFPIILDSSMKDREWKGDFGRKLQGQRSVDACDGSDFRSDLNSVIEEANRRLVDFPAKPARSFDGRIQFFLTSSQEPEKYDEKIETIASFLEGKGHRVIRDKTHSPSNSDNGKSVQKYFLESNCVLFLVTKEYHDKILLKNEGGCNEWKLTHYSETHIYFPIILDSSMREPQYWGGDFGNKLGPKLYTDASGDEFQRGVEKVIKEAKRKLARRANNIGRRHLSKKSLLFLVFVLMIILVVVGNQYLHG
jgi:hypothetical protein